MHIAVLLQSSKRSRVSFRSDKSQEERKGRTIGGRLVYEALRVGKFSSSFVSHHELHHTWRTRKSTMTDNLDEPTTRPSSLNPLTESVPRKRGEWVDIVLDGLVLDDLRKG